MSTLASPVEPAVPARTSGLNGMFEHTRYVLGENRVTAFAFGLLAIVAFVRLAQRRRLGFVSPCPDPSSHARTHDRT